MDLRPYQSEAVDAILARFAAGDQRTLCVLPTGGGKTIVAAHVARRLLAANPGKRVMVLTHRDELARQGYQKFGVVTGIQPAMEKADERSCEDGLEAPSRVIVSSIQTQVSGRGERRRMHRFCPAEFCLVWVDEGHHAVAGTWRKVIDHYAGNPECKVLFVTATADRADKEGLGQVCQSVAYRYELPNIISDGYLVPICPLSAFIEDLDFSTCRTTAGDLNAADAEALMMAEKPFHGVVHATLEAAFGLPQHSLAEIRDAPNRAELLEALTEGRRPRRTLVFTVGVKQAERTADVFNRWLPDSAASIDGGMSRDGRRGVLRDFKSGRIRFLVNCMIATEGFDEPGVELVSIARPTKSRSLYAQMVGRGTRPAEAIAATLGTLATADERRALIEQSDKPRLEVLDFVGNAGRHKLVSTVDLLGCAYEPAVVEIARLMIEGGEDGDVQKTLEVAKAELERRRRESEERKRKAELEAERRRQAEVARRAGLVGTATYSLMQVDPFDPFGVSIDRRGESARRINPNIDAKHERQLHRFGVADAEIRRMRPETAKELSGRLTARHESGLATWRQCKALRKRGWTKETLAVLRKDAARSALDEIAQREGWKQRPERVA